MSMDKSRRQAIARSAAGKLKGAELAVLRGVLGFDGFVDEIIDVVDKRQQPHAYEKYERLATIEEFAGKVAGAAGQSCNFELVTINLIQLCDDTFALIFDGSFRSFREMARSSGENVASRK